MIDSETGLPYDWSNPGGGSASTQTASMQPASAPTPVGQGAGQGGALSPTLMQLLGGGGGGLLPLLMQYYMGQGGGSAAPMQPAYGTIPSTGANGQILSPLAQYLMGQQQQRPQFGAPNANQQSWMTQMGWGNDLNALTPLQRGGLNTALGTTTGPDALANAQYGTPQDFVSQWQKMFGST